MPRHNNTTKSWEPSVTGAAQQHIQYDNNKLARETKVKTTVEGWLGEDDFPSLLNLINVQNEINLLVTCPVHGAMALAPKVLKMAHLQSAIDRILNDR